MASAKGRQSGVRSVVSGAVAAGLTPMGVCEAGMAAEDISAWERDTGAVMTVSCDKRNEGRRPAAKGGRQA